MPERNVFSKCGDEKCSLQTVFVSKCWKMPLSVHYNEMQNLFVIARVLNNNWKVWDLSPVHVLLECP